MPVNKGKVIVLKVVPPCGERVMDGDPLISVPNQVEFPYKHIEVSPPQEFLRSKRSRK